MRSRERYDVARGCITTRCSRRLDLAFDGSKCNARAPLHPHFPRSWDRVRSSRHRQRESVEPARRAQPRATACAGEGACNGKMSQIDELPPLREVIRRHGLSARKSLGQNFLLDLNLTGRIARAAGPLQGIAVVEVGPGPAVYVALFANGADACFDRARRTLHRGAWRNRSCYPGR